MTAPVLTRLSELVSVRRRAVPLLVAALLLVGLVMGLAGGDGGTEAPEQLPGDAESSQAADRLKEFPGGDVVPAMAVVSRTDGPLTDTDTNWLTGVTGEWARVVGTPVGTPVPSPDGQAVLVTVPVKGGVTGLELSDLVEELRDAAAVDRPDGLTVELTGGAAFAADISAAFSGADVTLLVVTALVVAVLLVLTYRSPVLWLVPLVVIALADRTAMVLNESIAEWTGGVMDGSTSGISSVLVFGAGANYALLLVSRYREELHRHEDSRAALAAAVRGAVPAIVASNVTVVLALLVLLLSVQPNSRSLGLAAAVGLLVALAFGVLVLPAALALFGRGLFWPFVPRVTGALPAPGAWRRVAGWVVAHARVVLPVALVGLVLLGSGLLGVKFGLSQTDQFRVEAESVRGLETLSEHFPSGSSDPVRVVVRTDAAAEAAQLAGEVDGVDSVRPAGESGTGRSLVLVTLDEAPGTPGSLQAVRDLRTELGGVAGADALVGGTVAEDVDLRAAAQRDLRVIVPLILLVVFGVLVVLLRSLVAPLVLLAINLVSTGAAMGAGVWVSRHVFDFPALDVGTPLYVFLFLVALGIDYTIFLVTRAREEALRHGTVQGMAEAVGHTGGVITSAGLVLAAVFVVLGVLPLITLTQIGIIVGLGILLDTFVVRTVVVPAVFALLGDRIWWPSRFPHRDA